MASSAHPCRPSACGLAAAVLTAVCPAQEREPTSQLELAQQIRVKAQELENAKLEAFANLRVNGVALPANDVMREVVHLLGSREIDVWIRGTLLERTIAREIAAGRDPADFEVSEQEMQSDSEKVLAEFREKNPDLSIYLVVRAQHGMTADRFWQSRRQELVFDKVFFPGEMSEWPKVTLDAIGASHPEPGSGEKPRIPGLRYPQKELPEFWMRIYRKHVVDHLERSSDIRFPSDDLPDGVCLAVDDVNWSTADAIRTVCEAAYPQDIERALVEIVIREALRQELERAEAYLDDDAWRAQFREYRKRFDSTPFTTEVLATRFKGYPSLEAFRQRWRSLRSFERMIDPEVTDAVLRQHAKTYHGGFSNGSVDLEVIPFPARDRVERGWSPDGMNTAKERAETAMREIEGGTEFDAVRERRGDFSRDPNLGRLPGKMLHQARSYFHESEFTDLMQGHSIARFLFFDAEPGRVYGPMRGPEGYYIARVKSRNPGKDEVSLKVDTVRERVRADYVERRFLEFANDVLKRARVESK